MTLALLFGLAWPATPARPDGEPARGVSLTVAGDPPITIMADQMEARQDEGRVLFTGQVSIQRGGETITAERALWHDQTKTAELSGGVRLVTPDFVALAERAVANLDLQLAKIYGGRAFFPARHYYIRGEVIERQGRDTLFIQNGLATTCDGPEPAWSIVARNLTVTRGGYAEAAGVTIDTKYFPALYLPYFLFPVKNERQTGFLMPGLSSSTRDGLIVSLPFFWASDENYDLTFTPVWRDERGLSSTLEGRYHLEHGRGIWQGTYLNDHSPQIFGYESGEQTTTKQRYWVRTQNNWRVDDWDINLDLDLVSDPLYLNAFKGDPDGFNYSQAILREEFGRTVNEYLDPLRLSTLFVQNTGVDSYFRGALEYTENLYSRHNVDTIQRLPDLRYSLVGRPWPEAWGNFSGFKNRPRFNLDARYGYFYRDSNEKSLTNETGHRLLLTPALDWTTDLGGVASLSLGGDLGLAMYALSGYRPSPLGPNSSAARHDRWKSRVDGSFTAGVSTTLNKVYEGGPGQAVAVRHQMTPTVAYTVVQAPDQAELPYWDMFDRRLSRRTVRYGLLNALASKTPVVDQESGQTTYEYFQFLKVGLWSSYEMADNLLWAENQWARYYTEGYFDKGAGPLEIEIEAFINPYVSAHILSMMDARTGDFTSHDLAVNLADRRGDHFYIVYDFDSPLVSMGTRDYLEHEEIRTGLKINLSSDWSASFSTRYDLHGRQRLETYASLRYQAQCYGLALLYSDSEDDRRVGLAVDLLGLGSLASGSEDMLFADTPANQ